VALFRRRHREPEVTEEAPPDLPSNLLPNDNPYLPAALTANDEFSSLGWQIRVAAVRMETAGQLDIALVVPGEEPESLREGLAAVPGGSSEIVEVLHRHLETFDESIHPIYFSEGTWQGVGASPRWQPAS
jgi:hypothetical protein